MRQNCLLTPTWQVHWEALELPILLFLIPDLIVMVVFNDFIGKFSASLFRRNKSARNLTSKKSQRLFYSGTATAFQSSLI